MVKYCGKKEVRKLRYIKLLTEFCWLRIGQNSKSLLVCGTLVLTTVIQIKNCLSRE